jgi:hypothetical protein
MGNLYSAALEVGSFLELDDNYIAKDDDGERMPAEIRRALEDLVRTVAPWLRRFPSIRELDDATAAYLGVADRTVPAATTIAAARSVELLAKEDAELLAGLVAAATRHGPQSEKGQKRGVGSAKNLLIAAATLIATGVYGPGIAEQVAPRSMVVARATRFILETEQAAAQLFADASSDVQFAMRSLARELRTRP